LITIQNVTVEKYGKKILSIPHLDIQVGEMTAIIGPNGAGKSTLIKTIALLEDTATGSIQFEGQSIQPSNAPLGARRSISVVFQQPLMLDTTVFGNVSVGLKIRGYSKKEVKEKVSYWLNRLNVGHLANRHARTLSGGEAQRIALARALVTEPKILLLDEPFSALDLPTKRAILHDLKTILKETGITTLFISHDYQEALFLTDEFIVIHRGELIGRYTYENLKQFNSSKELGAFIKEWMTPLVANV
jgi:tungstate transport system ATP-binding protein